MEMPGQSVKAPSIKIPDVSVETSSIKMPDLPLEAPSMDIPDLSVEVPSTKNTTPSMEMNTGQVTNAAASRQCIFLGLMVFLVSISPIAPWRPQLHASWPKLPLAGLLAGCVHLH